MMLWGRGRSGISRSQKLRLRFFFLSLTERLLNVFAVNANCEIPGRAPVCFPGFFSVDYSQARPSRTHSEKHESSQVHLLKPSRSL